MSVYNGERKRGLFMKPCWAQYLLWLVIAVLGTASLLSACGQKGSLTRPDPASERRAD